MKTKKWLSVFLATILLLNVGLPADVYAGGETETADEVTVYVSASGNDTTGDGTQSNPYASISKAEAVLEENTAATTGKIVVSGSVVFSAATHTKMITITGDGNTETELRLGEGDTIPADICGPTTMENIDLKPLHSNFNAGLLETGQHELIFGEGVLVKQFNGNFRVGADKSAAGDSTGTGSTPTLIINSLAHNNPAWSSNNIRVGTQGNGAWMNGANITINGGTINEVNLHRATQFSKDVNIVINGGEVKKIYRQVNEAAFGTNYLFKGALQVVFNNGIRAGEFDKASFDSITDNGGKWYMYGGTGGSLSVTETAGTFLVQGEKKATATLKSDSTQKYTANPGEYLVVPAGEYDVTYLDRDPGEVTVYVSSSEGNDDTGNGTEVNPYATISKAETVLEEDQYASTGKIVISGSVEFTTAAHTKKITITGDGAEDTKLVLNKSTRIAGPTTVERLTLYNDTNGYGFITEGQKLVVGEEVTAVKGGYAYMTLLVGDYYRGVDSGRPTMEINSFSGLAPIVQVGTRETTSSNVPGADVILNRGKLNQINLSPSTGITYTDDVNVTVNGGDPGLIQVYKPATFNKALQIVLNNGVSASKIDANVEQNATVVGGKWIMCGNTTGGSLSTTGTAGTFKVNGEMYAKATLKSNTTKVYYGNPGETLTVPEGEYDVTYLDRNPDGSLREVTVYVSASGNDTTGDGTQGNPYATISNAETVLEANTKADIGKIIIHGEIKLDVAKHSKMITIEGDGETGTKLVIDTYARLYGPTTFNNITIDKKAYNGQHLVTGWDKLVLGENVKFARNTDNSNNMMNIHVGDYYAKKDTVGNRPELEVNSASGAATIVTVGGSSNSNISVPGANIVVNSGTLNQINLATEAGIVYTNDVNITVNGGKLENGVLSNKTATFEGAFQYVINDGTGNTKVKKEVQDKITAKGGAWYMYDDVNEALTYIPDESKQYAGCKLATTGTAGTFDVVNGSGLATVYAVVTNLANPTLVYYSTAATADENGTLTVPEGEWVVTYVTERPEWYCTGSQVVFNERVENFDLGSITTIEYEDKIIVGWKNGEVLAENGTFESGTCLDAVYATSTKKANFNVAGTEMRLDDGALRFKINMGMNLYSELNATEYGIIAIKAANVAYKYCGDIKIGENYNGKTPAVIKAQNIYSFNDNIITYTLCLKDIADTAEAYNTDYMIRGYVKFTDQNDNVRVLYTDFEQSSVKATVEKMLSDDTVSESIKNSLNEKYMPVINAERTRLAATYQGTEVSIDDGINQPLKVREITVNKVPGSNTEELTLVQLTDMHINNLSEKDFVDNRQTVLSFYRNRKYGKDAAFAKVAERALKYADAVADQVVITGDTLDNLNEGALDIQKRLIWSKYPNIISTTGNHDWMEVTVGSISEVLTKQEAQERLQEDATHDVLYSSKVMKDVMLIQMDNAALNDGRGYGYGYEQSQIEKLTADLAIAREKGYTVLIFQHVALPTDAEDNNGLDLEIRTPDTTPANDKTSGVCNKAMIQLIKDNSDIIKAIFCGHEHKEVDTYVGGIPQYLASGTHYDGGRVVKITVK